MKDDIKLMKGNEVLAHAAIRYGADAYFGYPITPQSEVLETFAEEMPWKDNGMVVLQAESEVAAINMVYGGAAAGRRVITTTSSPGLSLMCEGISYLAGAELPCLLVDVARGGPGLGSIQASQADYFQVVKGGGHGDYKLFVLAPNSVQEMNDFVGLGFEVAYKYRIPSMILTDGVIGQMMEKVKLSPIMPRWTEEDIRKNAPWAASGKVGRAKGNTITSLELESANLEMHNLKLQAKYKEIEENEVRFEEMLTDDAEFILVAYGTSSRICAKTVELAREQGLKVGLLRPITLFPFPTKRIEELSKKVKGMLCIEMSAGQMVEDVRLAAACHTRVQHWGRYGGMIHTPNEVLDALKKMMEGK